jgi:chromosome segregation ATPase
MNVNVRLFRRVWKSVPILAALFLSAAVASAQEGVKETEQFIKAGEKTSESIAEAKQQMQTTLTNYSELLGKSATDMKDSYKKLVKNIKETDEKIADARERVTKMQETGKTYFDGRAVTIKKIQDPTLQTQAQERLTASQRGFDGVLTSLRQTRESLDPVRKELGDQVKYLESDLSPSGTASLKPQAEKTKAGASDVFTKLDEAVRTANAYFNGLRAK